MEGQARRTEYAVTDAACFRVRFTQRTPTVKHCVLAILEQGKPSASAEFLISTTSQWVIATRPSIVFCLISIQKPPKLVNVEGNAVLGNSHFHPLHFDLCTYTENYIVQSLVHFYPRCQP